MKKQFYIVRNSGKRIIFLTSLLLVFHMSISYTPFYQDYPVRYYVEQIYCSPIAGASTLFFDLDKPGQISDNNLHTKVQSQVSCYSFSEDPVAKHIYQENCLLRSVNLSINRQEHKYLSFKGNALRNMVQIYQSGCQDDDDMIS